MAVANGGKGMRGWYGRMLDNDIAYSFFTTPTAIIAATVTLLAVAATLFAPWIAPWSSFPIPFFHPRR